MVNWTAEKDQILLKGTFQFLDIKTSGPLLQHLADLIGEGCTPKAVSHRLTNIKNTGKASNTPNKSGKSTPAKGTPSKTPGSGRGRGRPPKKKVVEEGEEPGNDFGMSMGNASPSAGRKRGRSDAAGLGVGGEADAGFGGEEEREEKKIKMKDFEELGNGGGGSIFGDGLNSVMEDAAPAPAPASGHAYVEDAEEEEV